MQPTHMRVWTMLLQFTGTMLVFAGGRLCTVGGVWDYLALPIAMVGAAAIYRAHQEQRRIDHEKFNALAERLSKTSDLRDDSLPPGEWPTLH